MIERFERALLRGDTGIWMHTKVESWVWATARYDSLLRAVVHRDTVPNTPFKWGFGLATWDKYFLIRYRWSAPGSDLYDADMSDSLFLLFPWMTVARGCGGAYNDPNTLVLVTRDEFAASLEPCLSHPTHRVLTLVGPRGQRIHVPQRPGEGAQPFVARLFPGFRTESVVEVEARDDDAER